MNEETIIEEMWGGQMKILEELNLLETKWRTVVDLTQGIEMQKKTEAGKQTKKIVKEKSE